MQPGEYHFVTDSKNALFTDDKLSRRLERFSSRLNRKGIPIGRDF